MPASLHIDGPASQEISGVINSRQWSLFNRQYSIEIDTLHDRFKDKIVDPWIRELKEEGERTLLEVSQASIRAAKDWMASALLEKEDRYKRELEAKRKEMHVGEAEVSRFTAVYTNLLSAEAASTELLVRISDCRAQSGQ